MSCSDEPHVNPRICTIGLREMRHFIEAFNRLAMPILLPVPGQPMRFWTSLIGPQNQFAHLWWGDDRLADDEQRSRERETHPGFPDCLAASEQLIVGQEARAARRAELFRLPGHA